MGPLARSTPQLAVGVCNTRNETTRRDAGTLVDARRVTTRDEDGDPRGERGTPRRGGDARVVATVEIPSGRSRASRDGAFPWQMNASHAHIA